MLELHAARTYWQVPVMATEAVNNVGIKELYDHIARHRKTLEETGLLEQRRKEQRRHEFLDAVESRIREKLFRLVQQDTELSSYMAKVEAAEIAPISAADEVLQSGKLLDSWTQRLKKRRS